MTSFGITVAGFLIMQIVLLIGIVVLMREKKEGWGWLIFILLIVSANFPHEHSEPKSGSSYGTSHQRNP